eukprot:m.40883 g.40883  ORF g.40883 m.40883 type:complete len:62 (-) comp14876_c1_seq1:478-663(-)
MRQDHWCHTRLGSLRLFIRVVSCAPEGRCSSSSKNPAERATSNIQASASLDGKRAVFSQVH